MQLQDCPNDIGNEITTTMIMAREQLIIKAVCINAVKRASNIPPFGASRKEVYKKEIILSGKYRSRCGPNGFLNDVPRRIGRNGYMYRCRKDGCFRHIRRHVPKKDGWPPTGRYAIFPVQPALKQNAPENGAQSCPWEIRHGPNASYTSSPTSNASNEMPGPITACTSDGSVPYASCIAPSVVSTMRSIVPLHPAWTAATA